jgi:O-antigen ligase
MSTAVETSLLKENEAGWVVRLRVALLFLIALSLPFDRFYSTMLLYTLIAATLVDISRRGLKSIPKQFWVFQLVYFLGVAGYFYSHHKDMASGLLGRQLAILVVPLLFPLAFPMEKRVVNSALSGIAISCVISIAYLLFHMLWVIKYQLGITFAAGLSSAAFFNHAFSRPIGIHAGYLSLYTAFSMTYLVWRFSERTQSGKVLSVVGILILQTGLLFLASRNTLIATLVVLLVVYPFFAFRYRWRTALITLLCFIASVVVILNVPYLRERFSKQLVTDIGSTAPAREVTYGAAEPRAERWKAGWTLVKRSPLIGYGTGDEIPMLRTEYIRGGMFISYMEELNAHNQYLSYLLKNGIIGLIIFAASFIYFLRLAYQTRSFIYTAFLVLLLIGFYTENILDANKGIFFFAIFNTLLGYQALQQKSESLTPSQRSYEKLPEKDS